MNNEIEYIFKCPHCENEINSLYYNVTSRESGRCSIFKEHITPNRPPSYRNPSNNGLYLNDYDTENSSWDGDPDYECRECGHSIEINEIIVEQETQEPAPEQIKPIEENDAVESITKLIIKIDKKEKINPYDFSNMGLCKCPNCKHTFCTETNKITKNEEFVFCPKCGEEINVADNRQNIINKTLTH